MSKSTASLALLWAYRRERFPLALYLPLAGLLVLAAQVGERAARPTATEVAFMVLAAAGLVFQFRLWDDLHDREVDAVRHPERVLPSAPIVAPFIALAGLVAVINGALLLNRSVVSHDATALALFVALNVLYIIRYRFQGEVNHHLGLIKYPAFVYLLAVAYGAQPSWLAIGLVYFTFCSYEVLHDQSVDQRWLWPDGAGWCAMALLLAAFANPYTSVQVAIGVGGVVAFLALLIRHATHANAPWLSRGVFVLALIQLAALFASPAFVSAASVSAASVSAALGAGSRIHIA